MAQISYSEQSASIRNAYRDGAHLVLLPFSSLPDVCVACGNQANGNVIRKVLPKTNLWWLWPFPFEVIQLIFGTRYVFDFPFCPNCPPERFQLKATRLDRHLAIFRGTSQLLLESLPNLPMDVAMEKNRTWFERKLRSLDD
jgi:hypothetical protein